MPVDYAEAQKIQTIPLNIEPGVRESAPVVRTPAPATPTATPAPATPTRPAIPKPQPRATVPSAPTAPLPIPDTLPAPPAPQTSQIPEQNLGLKFAQQSGVYSLGGDIAYIGNYYFAGVLDGFSNKQNIKDNTNFGVGTTSRSNGIVERGSYENGYKDGTNIKDGIKDAIKEGQKVKENLWKNKPKFEIPDIRLPKLPELPEIELPKIPEFKFPEILFPKPKIQPQREPKPQPPDPFKREDQEKLIRDSEQHFCGDTYFTVIYCRLVTGYVDRENPDGSTSTIPTYEAGSIDEFSISARKYLINRGVPQTDNYYADPIYYITSGSGFGQSEIIYKGSQPNFSITPKGGQTLSKNGSYNLEFPFWETYHTDVRVYPSGSANDALDYINDGYKVLVTNFYTNSKKQGCVVPQPEPQTSPPKPKEKCCMCCEIDYLAIKRIIIASLKEQKSTIQIPIITCEFNETKKEWEPKTTNTSLEFFATSEKQAQQLAQLHLDNAKQFSDLCLARNKESDGEAIAAIPSGWELRPEYHRPQLIFQFSEVLKNNKFGAPKYPLTIPHPKILTKPQTSPIPVYKKGNWEIIYVLKDNSKITIHAFNEPEGIKVLNAAKQIVKPEYLEGAYLSKCSKVVTKEPLEEINVKPRLAKYYPRGAKSGKPEWIAKF